MKGGLVILGMMMVHSYTAQILKGKVFELQGRDSLFLEDVQVVFKEGGQSVMTDSSGYFEFTSYPIPDTLYVNAFGYVRVKYFVSKPLPFLFIPLRKAGVLDEVEIISSITAQEYSILQPLQVQNFNEQYLRKAACCNLSESFETNASIDVQLTDAITGIRQIQLNGLTGKYILLTRENMPFLFGIQSALGLHFLPGPFIQSIQLAKGVGSVLNGTESFAGQINTECWHPALTDFKMYLNTYFNQNARNEYNLILRQRYSKDASSHLMLHSSFNPLAQDMNHDGYTDIPTGRQWNMMYKYFVQNDQGLEWQFGVHTINDERKSGQIMSHHPYKESPYVVSNFTQRTDIYSKPGWVFNRKPGHSIGLQMIYSSYYNQNTYGKVHYEGKQDAVYANLIYQGILGTTAHTYKAGATFYNINAGELFKKISFFRKERATGTFAEYSYVPSPALSILCGSRIDYHVYYGWIFVPRFHLKWNFNNQNSTFKLSAGRAFRTPNPLAENIGFMVSNREFYFHIQTEEYPYGLRPEKGWTTGVNFYHTFRLFYRPASILGEFYYTYFTSQVLADADTPGQVHVYVTPHALARTLQTEIKFQPVKRLEVHLSGRYVEQYSRYRYGYNLQPFIPRFRGFMNLVYTTRNKKWNLDFTAQYTSPKRLPYTFLNPAEFQLDEYSFPFWNLLAQISYTLKKGKHEWHIYAGMENLNNFRLMNPILASETPSSPYFDASMVWASVYGRMGYVGLRFYVR